MKNLFILSAFSLLFISCEGDEVVPVQSDNANDELKKENLHLKRELADKDSTINYYVSFVNEVRSNLGLIQQKHGVIMTRKSNPEMLNVENPDLIEELKTIGELMADSESKIARLKSEIKNTDLQMSEFEEMIISLTEDVEMKNMEIFQLHQELENLDGAFTELFDAFEEKSVELNEANAALNQAYFTYGSREELLENGVITKEGGFIGIGKIDKLKDDFNKNYFTEIEIDNLTEIPLGVKKAEIITVHPANSFELVGEEPIEKIKILDNEAFWSVSKYLVIVVK